MKYFCGVLIILFSFVLQIQAAEQGKNKIMAADSSIEIWEKACPLFVPLVENGYLHSEATRIIAEDYLKDTALAEYYEKELGLEETAERLRVLAASEASLKELALVLYSVTPMYTGEEVEEYLALLEQMQELKLLWLFSCGWL